MAQTEKYSYCVIVYLSLFEFGLSKMVETFVLLKRLEVNAVFALVLLLWLFMQVLHVLAKWLAKWSHMFCIPLLFDPINHRACGRLKYVFDRGQCVEGMSLKQRVEFQSLAKLRK